MLQDFDEDVATADDRTNHDHEPKQEQPASKLESGVEHMVETAIIHHKLLIPLVISCGGLRLQGEARRQILVSRLFDLAEAA